LGRHEDALKKKKVGRDTTLTEKDSGEGPIKKLKNAYDENLSLGGEETKDLLPTAIRPKKYQKS